MTPIEQMLRAAAADAAWPETPDVAAAVLARIQARRDPMRIHGRRDPMRIRRPLVVLLAAFLVLAGAAAAVPSVRDPVLDWLGLRSVHVERVQRLPARAPGAKLALGTRMTLADAVGRVGFKPVVPTGLGAATVYYDRHPPGGTLALVYRNGRLFLTEFEASLSTEYVYKFVTPASRIDRLRVDGQRGLWVAGLHAFAYADRTGTVRPETVRTAGRVLLWRRGPLLMRLEGARSKTEALAIAHSLREAP